MTTPGFNVQSEELDAHSKQVNGTAEQLAQALSAGQQTTPLGSQAFGVIGQPFALIAQGSVTSALNELQAVTATARQLASGVGRAGEAYRGIDEDAKNVVQHAGREV